MLSLFARPLRRAAVATTVAALSLTTFTPTSASAADAYADEGSSAARWLGGELTSGRIVGEYGSDWGLTLDTGFALAADGSQPIRLGRLTEAVRNNYDVYTGSGAEQYAGATAKVLVFAKVVGANARDFGGADVRSDLLALEEQSGPDAGRLSDSSQYGDYSNTIGQSLGVIGLARSGGVPTDVVTFLLRQQCSTGYFSLYITSGTSCDAAAGAPHVDATAFAVQALLAAERSGVAVADWRVVRAARWLKAVQRDNGSFAEDGGDGLASANSTGLAAQALQALGHSAARQQAAAYVASIQITAARAGDGPARTDIGAIAFNRAQLRTALRDGVTDSTRGTFRRATAQAYFALVPRPLGTLRAP